MRPTVTAAVAAAASASAFLAASVLSSAEAAVPIAGEIRLGQTVRGDTRDGLLLGSYRNQFWRLPPLRRLDRVRVRLLASDYHYLCAYGPHERALGLLEDESPCQVGSTLGAPPQTFRATPGPGTYLLGVSAAVDGPYRLRLERIQHHVGLRLLAPARLPAGGAVTVRVAGGAGEPLSSPALRVRLEAQFADGRRRLLGAGSPVAGRVRLRVILPADIAPYLYRDHPVTLRARLRPSRDHIGAASARRRVHLG